MPSFSEFLRANGLKQVEVAEYLGLNKSSISSICAGRQNLTLPNISKLKRNPYGWDTSMLTDTQIVQTIGNHSNNNTQSVGDADLWKKLCEEKDKRIAELERTIQILLNNGNN